ncbi:hypothetical protein ACFL7M_11625 [Thermodesulfobacteriota bacterium]
MVPRMNTTMEPEFYRMAPEGVTFHFDRLGLVEGGEGDTPEEVGQSLRRVADEAVICAKNFSKMLLDGFTFACTSGSLIGRENCNQQLIGRLKKVTKIPITTTSTAVIKDLNKVWMNRVVVVTPEVNEKENDFREGHDIRVLRIESIKSSRQGSTNWQKRSTCQRLKASLSVVRS